MLKGCIVKSAGPEGAPDPPTSLQLPVWAALSRGLFLPLALPQKEAFLLEGRLANTELPLWSLFRSLLPLANADHMYRA